MTAMLRPTKPHRSGISFRILALEPRMMFDGAAAGDVADKTAADSKVADTAAPAATSTTDTSAKSTAAAAETEKSTATATVVHWNGQVSTDSTGTRNEVVVVDTTVADWQTLVAGINPNIPVILLTPDSNGYGELEVLAQIMSQFHDLDAIHLVAEGRTGAILLGKEVIWNGDVTAATPYLSVVGAALKDGGDFMLYSCSVAKSDGGKAFVDSFARALGDVDVAASTDLTGPTRLGGDWDLEYTTGDIETVLPFTLQGMQDISHCLGCTMDSAKNKVYLNGTLLAHFPSGGTDWVVDSTFHVDLPPVLTASAGQTFGQDLYLGPFGDGQGQSAIDNIVECQAPAGPTFSSGTTANFAENGTGTVYTAAATGSGTITYSLNGGADSTKFSINSTTGVLTFVPADSSPDFENPADADHNNTYLVIIRATDSSNNTTTDQTVTVTVTNVNEAPTITSGATATFAENGTGTVYTATSSDPDAGATKTYSISGGVDSAKFSINSSTGALTFVAAPNYESPTDTGGDNIYDVVIQVSDGSLTATKAVAITVTNVNEAPTFTSGTTANFAENGNGTVYTATSSDPDSGATANYSIVVGGDSAKFSIDTNTGALTFVGSPDRENPTDSDHNNTYVVTVRVSDGLNTTDQTVTVTVTDVNDTAPVVTSNGGGATASVNVAENSTAVTTVTATDADSSGTLSYSIAGGADSALFAINSSTGVLSFVSGRDRETPSDSDANNTYVVQVQVSDGTQTTTQTITVTITDVNEFSPTISSNGGAGTAAVSVVENSTAVTTVTATDGDASPSLSYSISGGADAAKFAINAATGVLTFVSGPDFENPTDSDTNNTYVVTVRVSDGTNTADQTITVTVTDTSNENPPVITSNGGGATASINVAENSTAVTTVTATDADVGATQTYSISGGADAAKFTINATTGVLSFVSAPDRENPTDSDANNAYVVIVQVSDGLNTATQTLTVTVTDVNDTAPTISSNGGGATASVNVAENATAVTTVTATDADTTGTLSYSITGGSDSAKFAINSSTGVLTFVSGQNFEAPSDSDTNNTYVVQVQVSDGTQTTTQTITVTVTNVNEFTPAITSNGGGATAAINVAENTTAVTTVAATDADAGASLSYSIVGGADQAKFAINAATGVLTFVSAPDREAPTDTGSDNTYVVQVQVSDGTHTTTQTITVTITDGDPPTASGTALTPPKGTENTAYTYALPAGSFTDSDVGDTLTYTASGLPSGLTIDGTTGAVSGTPSAGGTFSVVITATDSTGLTATKAMTIVIDGAPTSATTAAPKVEAALPTPAGNGGETATGTGDGDSAGLVTSVLETTVNDKPAGMETVVRTVTLAPSDSAGAGFSLNTGTGTGSGGLGGGLGGGITSALGDTRSSGTGGTFQVALAGRAPGGGDALVVNTRVPDASFDPGTRISVTVPGDAFAHTRADATVTLSATRGDGAALPGWMNFNPRTGTFEGTPPPNFRGEVVVKVTARDGDGRQVVQTFKIVVGQGQGSAAPDGGGEGRSQGAPGRSGDLGPDGKLAAKGAGRPGLTEQLRQMSFKGGVARHIAMFDTITRGDKVA